LLDLDDDLQWRRVLEVLEHGVLVDRLECGRCYCCWGADVIAIALAVAPLTLLFEAIIIIAMLRLLS